MHVQNVTFVGRLEAAAKLLSFHVVIFNDTIVVHAFVSALVFTLFHVFGNDGPVRSTTRPTDLQGGPHQHVWCIPIVFQCIKIVIHCTTTAAAFTHVISRRDQHVLNNTQRERFERIDSCNKHSPKRYVAGPKFTAIVAQQI